MSVQPGQPETLEAVSRNIHYVSSDKGLGILPFLSAVELRSRLATGGLANCTAVPGYAINHNDGTGFLFLFHIAPGVLPVKLWTGLNRDMGKITRVAYRIYPGPRTPKDLSSYLEKTYRDMFSSYLKPAEDIIEREIINASNLGFVLIGMEQIARSIKPVIYKSASLADISAG